MKNLKIEVANPRKEQLEYQKQIREIKPKN